jgi:serine/threonine protein kinase
VYAKYRRAYHTSENRANYAVLIYDVPVTRILRWSVGVILFKMLVGSPPFLATNQSDTESMIIHADQFLEFLQQCKGVPDFRQDAEDLIRRFFCQPDHRLGVIRGSDEFKEHHFFHGVEWEALDRKKASFEPELDSETDTRYFDGFENIPVNPKNTFPSEFNEDDASSVSQAPTMTVS